MAEIETVTLTVIGGPIRGVLQAVAREGAGAELAARLTRVLQDIYPSVETHVAVEPNPATTDQDTQP